MTDWSQYEEKTPSTQTKKEVENESVIKAAQTFATNIGRGATLGLAKYPAAAVQMGVRALTGAPVGTFGENVADVGEFYRQQEQQNPLAATSGRLVGGLAVPGLGVGKTILGTAGRGSVAGGVSGFTEDENLMDALKGSAIGGTIGLAGGTVASMLGSPVEKFVRSEYVAKQGRTIAREAEKVKNAIIDLQPVFDRITPRLAMNRNINPEKIVGQISTYNKKNNPIRNAGIRVTNEEIEVAKAFNRAKGNMAGANTKIEEAAAKQGPEFYDYVKSGLGYEALRGGQSYLQTAKEMLPNIALGAAGGAGMGAMTGMGPVAGAGMGAGLGGLYELKARGAPFITQALAAGLSRIAPTGTIPRMASKTFAQAAGVPPEPDYSAYEQYAEPQAAPVEDNRSRLQRLADDFRTRMGGTQ